MAKLLITVNRDRQLESIRADARTNGCEILAEYPDSLLVRCSAEQQQQLEQAGLEIAVLEARPALRVLGSRFALADAVEAEAEEPLELAPTRTAYYLVELIGPPKGEWLQAIQSLNGRIQGNLADYTLLVGLQPSQVGELSEQDWVEAVTPYRPAMKISPKLRPGNELTLNARALRTPMVDTVDTDVSAEGDAEGNADGNTAGAEAQEQIEIGVFAGEDVGAIAARVSAAGGTILGQTPQAVKALLPRPAIPELATDPAIQTIQPSAFPQWFNDRATAIMGVAPDYRFEPLKDLTLKGTNQIVAVCDSGIDTGEPNTIHPDLEGRIVEITSWPTNPAIAAYTNDPAGNDDGPADFYSGHGTHVAGSVLGNGAAAKAIADDALPIPQGTAPEAKLYFQAVEQFINWKTEEELDAAGIPYPRPWPPQAASLFGLPDDLTPLFETAYSAGARIHTNSWGADTAGLYTETSRLVDQFAWTHRDMCILFAAGNSGRDGGGNILPDSLGSPATAKNCITVGASENDRPEGSLPKPGVDANWSDLRWPSLRDAGHVSDNVDGMAAFSSRGPTDDQRIKPDVVAPGTNVLSLRTTVYKPDGGVLWGDLDPAHPLRDKYCWSGGTSMSTPLVAGAVALIRQYLVEQRGHLEPGVKPSGALLKAIVVNGAETMTGQYANEIPSDSPGQNPEQNSGQNPVSGFGRVNVSQALQRSLWFVDEPETAVETGQVQSYELEAIDLSKPLSLTLAWTDAPSGVGTGQLQNRLYLKVVTPEGTVLNGDVTPWPTVTNNVQRVVISTPVTGRYDVQILGVSVTQQSPGASTVNRPGNAPRQDFAIAATNVRVPSAEPPMEPPIDPPVDPPIDPPVDPPVISPRTFRISELFVVSSRGWLSSTLLAAKVVDENEEPVSPLDGIEVTMRVEQGDRQIVLDRSNFDRRTQLFVNLIWRIQFWGLRPGTAKLTAQAWFQGEAVAEATKEVSF